jgi:TRAP-type C4-dicarboxylate transport system permease small subunit
MILTGINEKIMKLLNWMIVLSMAAVTVLVFLQIVNRFIIKIPMPWTDEFAKYAFVWLAMYGSAKAVREKSHIFVDIIELYLKGGPGKVCAYVAEIISLIFYIILLVVSVPWTIDNMDVMADSAPIGMGYFYTCIPISALLMISFAIENLITRFKGVHRAEGGEVQA